MRKKTLWTVLAAGCLFAGNCLTLNPNALLAQGGSLICAIATSGLPGAGYVDYCAAIDHD